ncbi:CCA tRNA nucleotidyltransferase [Sphingomonas sinipercae]|uniref:CCA tRNA nucleotidyltransferase n=1 Tax=Sphingomonas sinipercae TaxID=2714944 RepID=A0A6G7ZQW2_9SPHN|nr:CCA tRNA nucleotidyltransferase [Sphingomonas sinipercae]QIL03315.1 CCA tRNA nucleotidyltransferase [Sphingomonas sinipercae]
MTIDVSLWAQVPGMSRILEALGANEGEVRYVGGCVRDRLLSLPVSDIDLATRLLPEDVVRRLEQARVKVVPTGIEHGTVTAISEGHVVEVTTLRRDVSTDGRRATVAFTDDWKEDAARRDFTINALMADALTGELSDYFGGLEDIAERRVRFIGDPLRRIAEDHLRILRFFRFHARFAGDVVDAAALQACTARANDLMALSRERIADELLKLLAVDDPSATVAMMIECGIFRPVLPEIEADALPRLSLLVRAEAEAKLPAAPVRRLSALLPRDAATAERVAARLKLSNKARKRLACAAEEDVGGDARALAYRIGVECAVDRLLLGAKGEAAIAIAGWAPPRLPIGGGALIDRGVTQGPDVAHTLKRIEEMWVEAGFPTGDEFEQIVDAAVEQRQTGR